MQDELPKLIKLQIMDIEIDDVAQKARSIVPLIARKNQDLEILKSSMKSIKERITSLQLKKKDLELQVEEKEKLIKKHHAELNSLKSNDAYKAMLGEIDAAKKQLTHIEDDILDVMESLEAADKEVKEADQKLKTQEGVIKNKIQELERQKAGFEEESKNKLEVRTTFTSEIAPANLVQYESLRKKKGGVAIVPLLNNGCGGCRMKLTPNKLVGIKIGKAIVVCDSCSRIIYQVPSDAPPATAVVNVAPTAPSSQS